MLDESHFHTTMPQWFSNLEKEDVFCKGIRDGK